MNGSLIRVEVAYALPEKQVIVDLRLPEGSCARDAVLASGLDATFVGLDLQRCPLGIFGHEVAEDSVLREGDRVEIYRPLVNEPRATRRALAAKGGTMGRQR